jgi:hypothetical protein
VLFVASLAANVSVARAGDIGGLLSPVLIPAALGGLAGMIVAAQRSVPHGLAPIRRRRPGSRGNPDGRDISRATRYPPRWPVCPPYAIPSRARDPDKLRASASLTLLVRRMILVAIRALPLQLLQRQWLEAV